MHRDHPLSAQVFENFHCLVRSHVNAAKCVRVISTNWQQSNLWSTSFADIFEAIEVRAVASVIDATALMLQHETAIAAMAVAQYARSPMFAWRERHFPIAMRKAFPPFEFDYATETEIVREITHAPRHDRDFRMGQAAQAG